MSFNCYNTECEFYEREKDCGQFPEHNIPDASQIIRCENRITLKQKEMCEECKVNSTDRKYPCQRDEDHNQFVCSRLFLK